MSTQDMKKLSTVLRSIEIIEGKISFSVHQKKKTKRNIFQLEKTNAMHEEFSKSLKDRENLPPMIINDQNVYLQLFFQHVEQLLQTDLKSKMKNETNSS